MYTPSMFYDILRMRRKTLEWLVDTLHFSYKANSISGDNQLEMRKGGCHLIQSHAWCYYTLSCRQGNYKTIYRRWYLEASLFGYMCKIQATHYKPSWPEVVMCYNGLPIQPVVSRSHWSHRWLSHLHRCTSKFYRYIWPPQPVKVNFNSVTSCCG